MTPDETPQPSTERRPHERTLPAVVVVAVGAVAVVGAVVTTIGADALWLPALGDHIRHTGSIPDGIPFAAAPSAGWVNTTVLGQLVFSVAHSVGSLGIVIAQVVVVAVTVALIAVEASVRGAPSLATALVVIAIALGAVTSLFIARAQLLSFVPFALLLALLRRQHDHPSPALWWAVPLVAVWGNLHGGVLVGVAVLGCYLLFSRLRTSPVTAVTVGIAALAAVCLNPGLARTPRYYLGVLGGEATGDDSGMWGRLTLANPFHLLFVVVAVALVVAALGRRRPLWEYAAGLGLLVATVAAARQGVWLLLFLAVPAATAIGRRHGEAPPQRRSSPALALAVAAVCALGAAGVLTLRAPTFHAADAQSDRIAAATRGQVVLTPEPLAESLAAAGATVWASDPLDAFASADQTAYLSFLRGDAAGARRALSQSDAVVAPPGSVHARLAVSSGLTGTSAIGALTVYTRP